MNKTQKPTRHHLACPSCKHALRSQDSNLLCTSCGCKYESIQGIPVLLETNSPDRLALLNKDGILMRESYMGSGKKGASSLALNLLRRIISSEYFPGKNWKAAKKNVISRCLIDNSLLIIGSGITRYQNAVHLDLDAFPGVDVIGDAVNLPFVEEHFEGVICEVVLEHVHNPARVIEEAYRVLKPGGSCFFIVPFLFPFHGHPNDYRRWSKEGLKADFSLFSHIETGIHGGPTSSLVNLITEWIYIASGQPFPRGYTAIKGLATAMLFPLKFLDFLINRFPEAHRLASTLYIYAEKRR